MNQISGPPNEYDFGLNFNYAVWAENTEVSLVNVPWNNDYRDVVRFDDRTALNAYIDSRENTGIAIDHVSYLKPNEPIRLDIPMNTALKFNYLRASNPVQPIAGDTRKDFYYFVTDVRYLAPNTTELVLQLDVWQTYAYDVSFGNCYIERGHIGIANEKAFDRFGRDYLTQPEGMDVGSEYETIAARFYGIMGPTGQDNGNGQNTIQNHTIIVISSVNLTADPGDTSNPKLVAATGDSWNFLPTGANVYAFRNATSYTTFMASIEQKPWISQGIMSVTIMPPIELFYFGFQYEADGTPTLVSDRLIPAGANVTKLARTINLTLMYNWRTRPEIVAAIPQRYLGLKKLWTFPYMAIEVTTFSGNPIILKPESWQDANMDINMRASFIPPNQRVIFFPANYNKAASQNDLINDDDGGEYLDSQVSISDMPKIPVVNNQAINFLASNANQIAFSRDQADWSQQKALQGNATSYDQASAGMQTAADLTNIGISADTMQTNLQNLTGMQQNMLNGLGGIVGGAAGGAAIGGPAGAVGGAAGGALNYTTSAISNVIQQNANSQANAIRNNAAGASYDSRSRTSGLIRDTNKGLADWAARGDYATAINGINAKVRDAALTQPSVNGQFGGDSLNLIYKQMGISIRLKMIDKASMKRVGEFWLRYGYNVMQFATPPADLKVMSKFTYWKMQETYLVATNIPEGFKQAIRGILEKGVTVWVSPEYIGATDLADNTPIGGITL